jgi:hypothetical protein
MYYHIQGLCPTGQMSGAGFHIQLWPEWKVLVAESGLTQEKCNTAIENVGRAWLDGCGFNAMYDPDQSPDDRFNKKKMGPNARPLYEPRTALRVKWGEWGSEHIDVPGDACGLDLDDRDFVRPKNGAVLLPHNVDSIKQAHLLLVVFTFFADCIIGTHKCNKIERTKGKTPDTQFQINGHIYARYGNNWSAPGVSGWVNETVAELLDEIAVLRKEKTK